MNRGRGFKRIRERKSGRVVWTFRGKRLWKIRHSENTSEISGGRKPSIQILVGNFGGLLEDSGAAPAPGWGGSPSLVAVPAPQKNQSPPAGAVQAFAGRAASSVHELTPSAD